MGIICIQGATMFVSIHSRQQLPQRLCLWCLHSVFHQVCCLQKVQLSHLIELGYEPMGVHFVASMPEPHAVVSARMGGVRQLRGLRFIRVCYKKWPEVRLWGFLIWTDCNVGHK